MTELQQTILTLLKTFDRICRENGLCYVMLGGTMLGAVREQGFIPWDDDADVGLPRRDYEELLKLPRNAFPEGVLLRHFSKEKGIPYAFARLEDETTTFIEARRSGTGYSGGVYIDIFPLDGDGTEEKKKRVKERQVNRLKKLLYTHIADYEAINPFWKKEVMKLFRNVTNEEKLLRKLDKVIRENGNGCLSNYLGHWGRKESIPREVFFSKEGEGKPVEYRFEDATLFGAVDADAYLTSLYGKNYIIPVRENEAVHAPKVLNLNQSFHKINQ